MTSPPVRRRTNGPPGSVGTFAPGTFAPDPRPAPAGRRIIATAGLELRMTLRNGEQLLLALVIPLLALVGGTLITVVEPARTADRRGTARGARAGRDVRRLHLAGDHHRLRPALRGAQTACRCRSRTRPADRRQVRGHPGRHRRPVRHPGGSPHCCWAGVRPAATRCRVAVDHLVLHHPARDRGLHRPGPAAGRHPAGRGRPGRRQPAVAGVRPDRWGDRATGPVAAAAADDR